MPDAEALFAAAADSAEGEKDARAAILALALAAPREFMLHIDRLGAGPRRHHTEILRPAERRGRRGLLLGVAAGGAG